MSYMSCCSLTTSSRKACNYDFIGITTSFSCRMLIIWSNSMTIENLASEEDELLISKLATLNEDSLKFRVTYILIK